MVNISCPVCTMIMMDEIYQCISGHLYCHTCIARSDKCHSCRTTLPRVKIRALVMEQMREYIDIKCEKPGCEEVTTGKSAYIEHQKSCKFNRCENAECKFMGTNVELTDHKFICAYRNIKCPALTLKTCVECSRMMKISDVDKHLNDDHRYVFNAIELKKPIKLLNLLDKEGKIFTRWYRLANGDKFAISIDCSTRTQPACSITVRTVGTSNYKCKYSISANSPHKEICMHQINSILPIDSDLSFDMSNRHYMFEIYRPFDKFITVDAGKSSLDIYFEIFV